MDITRNWRLKTSRSHLVATRCPETGAVILPQQNGAAAQDVELYYFQHDRPALVVENELDYAKAAR